MKVEYKYDRFDIVTGLKVQCTQGNKYILTIYANHGNGKGNLFMAVNVDDGTRIILGDIDEAPVTLNNNQMKPWS